jgi:hypothetical protein
MDHGSAPAMVHPRSGRRTSWQRFAPECQTPTVFMAFARHVRSS